MVIFFSGILAAAAQLFGTVPATQALPPEITGADAREGVRPGCPVGQGFWHAFRVPLVFNWYTVCIGLAFASAETTCSSLLPRHAVVPHGTGST
ncbi:hypothetical protein MKI84_19180 [Ancylobacter sp. A5.8]|uniref:hypothetical protein n=1 Tax=Ancylobacter gelatini TaxID=2919920 RepID=UPI001F4F0976|nr:hypothetical protein [Ancylobacter gelatini]MCJ8145051.1 hypothetical protein [Ancylobacter gelatini]